MHKASHLLRFHGQKAFEHARAPIWRFTWNALYNQLGGSEKFPAYPDFLASSTELYRHLQNELLSATNTRHLEDICTEELWPIVRSAGSEYEQLRRQHGDECRIEWQTTDAFICSLGPPDIRDEGSTQTVIVGARFFSVMHMAFDPDSVRHTIDDLFFVSPWDHETGAKQWQIMHIGGPVTPSE